MDMLTDEEGQVALQTARRAIKHAVNGEEYVPESLPAIFGEKRGAFVTIKKRGDLRGCIGLPYPIRPLGEAIVEAAISAALQDPRFPPVSVRELPDLDLEVTVLTLPEPLSCPPADRPEHVVVGKHGLIVSGLGTSGLLLPQVPVEYNWESWEFLDYTCKKAGLTAGCWKRSDVNVLTFEGQIFEEEA